MVSHVPAIRYYVSGDFSYLVWNAAKHQDKQAGDHPLEAIITSPFPVDLIQFAYADAASAEERIGKAEQEIKAFLQTKDPVCLDRANKLINSLLKIHSYFMVVIEDWGNRLEEAKKSETQNVKRLLPLESLKAIPAQVRTMQAQVKELFEYAFDVDRSEKSVTDRISQYYSASGEEADSIFDFGMLETRFEKTHHGCAEVLYAKDLTNLIDFALRQCIVREEKLRVCKNCGRYFVVSKSMKSEYCTLFPDEKGRTCRDVGAITTWTKKRENDDVFKNSRREYKKRFARIKAGTLPASAFYQWSEQARQQKALCETGMISPEEFAAWLAKS